MNRRLSKWVLKWVGAGLCALSGAAMAGPYTAGVHQWTNADGKLVLMSGAMTDNAAQYFLKYTFYFEASADKKLYQIPLVDGKDQSKYTLTVTESSDGDSAFEDASIVQKDAATWLLIGERETEPGDERSGPVAVKTYKLIAGNDGKWAYYFQLEKTTRHAGANGYTVEKALNDNAAALK
ncbi:hypothetical protein [Trinickia soli]|mgnify:CR=1 FL=1|nr:hypothetical protein [Trinickia soli]CAB3707032.1 hypothetical protein LMG24076_03762 [Trinickia soli]